MPPHPPKRGSLFIVPQSIRPQLVRTGIEVREFIETILSLLSMKKYFVFPRFFVGELEI